MAWLKLYSDMPRHPKITKLQRVTGLSRDEIVGKVCTLWCWVLEFSKDGDLANFRDDISGICGIDVGDLVSCGWLDDAGEKLCVHGWLDRSGSYAETARQRKYREKSVTRPSRDNHVLEVEVEVEVEVEEESKKTMCKSATDVANYYRERHPGKGRAIKPGHADYKRIQARLAEGFSISDLFLAVEGHREDKWHVENGNLTAVYCFRNSSKVEAFISQAKKLGRRPRRGPRVSQDMPLESTEGVSRESLAGMNTNNPIGTQNSVAGNVDALESKNAEDSTSGGEK